MNAARVAEVPVLFDESGRTWADVQRRIAGRLRANFPRVGSHLREDAVQEAMLDLFTYWRKLPSSQREGALTFNFAVQRGCWTAYEFMGKEVRRQVDHMAWPDNFQFQDDARNGLDYSDPEDEDISDAGFDIVDDSPGPEEQVLLAEEGLRLDEVLAKLDHDELHDVMELLASGKTQRDLAAELGISQPAVLKRQRRAARRLQSAAYSVGML